MKKATVLEAFYDCYTVLMHSYRDTKMNDISSRLKNKSIEAFLLAIEIYNKPTIKYRVEGFSFFIVNAWELMLKAHLVNTKGEGSIYYPDNPNRSLSIDVCVRRVFTNDKDPLRQNLEKIIELRNTSTHFITEEYETIYVPLFQANVINFSEKLNEFHGEDITDYIPENFLSLTVLFKKIDEQEIRGKYSDIISAKLLEVAKKIDESTQVTNSRFAIPVIHTHYLTKKKSEATNVMRIAREGEDPVMVLNKPTDPTKTHPFTAKRLLSLLNDRLRRANVVLYFHENIATMTIFHFTNLCKHYGIKDNPVYCFPNDIYKNVQYSYSQKTIDFLFEELCKAPDRILDFVAKRE